MRNSVVKAELMIGNATQGKVLLKIDDGWHINAHPASMEFLIPTSLKPEAEDTSFKVIYPEAKSLATGLGSINVYSGSIEIGYSLDTPAKTKKINLTAQACNEGTCIPPSTWTFELK